MYLMINLKTVSVNLGMLMFLECLCGFLLLTKSVIGFAFEVTAYM